MERDRRDDIASRFPPVLGKWRNRLNRLRFLAAPNGSFATRRASAGRRPADGPPIGTPPPMPDPTQIVASLRAGGMRIPSRHSFRVLYVVRPGIEDAACMRYRAYNLIEALRLVGIEAAHLDDRRIPDRLPYVLAFDLIVLVRRTMSPEIDLLLDSAKQCGIPVLYDLDDYLFHEEVIPYVECLRNLPLDEARGFTERFRDLILRCDGFTTTTPHLRDRAADLGVRSDLIRNGLNLAQIELSRIALEESRRGAARPGVRLGYFSGTLTHQDDFRLIADVLVRILGEFPQVSLTVAGQFDLREFPEFARFADRVEGRPFVDWRLLPGEMARADINLIPLRRNVFTEAKSNLKYYEAGLLGIPSVASPTPPLASAIVPGDNGLLAGTPSEWYDALRSLIIDPGYRRGLGDRAYEHVMRTYVPEVVADEAVSVYREVLATRRRSLGVADEAPCVTILLSDLPRAVRERSSVIDLAAGLAQSGAVVTLHLPGGCGDLTPEQSIEFLKGHFHGPAPAVQFGSEIPCCDLLLATDAITARRAGQFRHRARRAACFLPEPRPRSLSGAAPGLDQTVGPSAGLTLIVDSGTMDLYHEIGPEELVVIPTWVGRAPAPLDPSQEPRSVLIATTPHLPSPAREHLGEALRRLHATHPGLRLILCGDAMDRGIPGVPYERLPGLFGEEFERALSERPVCLVLHALARPAWVCDLMAAGCPVVSAPWFVGGQARETESTLGLVTVPLDGSTMAAAVDSLLVDRVRLSTLTHRAAAHVRGLADPREAARTLLRILESPGPLPARREDCASPEGLSLQPIASESRAHVAPE